MATVSPFFMNTPAGRLFAVRHAPADSSASRGQVLCVPPFNEEMNRCRSMLTKQALAFAEVGVGMLVIDLFGTGDSEGDYGDARWSIWLDNVRAGLAWANAQPGGLLAVLGVRLGAVLAAEAITKETELRPAFIGWQPVYDGKQHFTQFLRLRVAAQMDRTDLSKETTTSLRERLAAGQAVEIAGYEIHPELAAAIDGARLTSFPPGGETSAAWFEQASAGSAQASPASARAAQSWQAVGVDLQVNAFEGPAFWQLHERAEAPDVILKTTAWLCKSWTF